MTKAIKARGALLIGAAAALALGGISAPSFAQARDPAYAAARAAGQVGEKPDGYLGITGAAGSALRAVVDDINIKRRANYTARAKAQNATVEEYAVTQGCVLIARTVPGEKYMSPDGVWRTRTSEPPVRDPRCP